MRSVIDVYSDLARQNPVWTPEEEKEFIEKHWRPRNNSFFVEEALKHNLGLVFDLVNKTAFRPKDEDVFQKAVIALSNALKKFNPKKGKKISTWVTQPIKWAILQAQDSAYHTCSIADEVSDLNYKKGTNLRVVSVDQEVGGGKDDAERHDTVGDLISVHNIDITYSIARSIKTRDEEVRSDDIKNGISELMEKIDEILLPREKTVFLGLLNGESKSDVARRMKLSRMRVCQISADAFQKIRNSKFADKLHALIKA